MNTLAMHAFNFILGHSRAPQNNRRRMGHLGNNEPMEESYAMLIAFGVLALVSPILLCIWRYHTPFADEKYRIEHKKWAEAVKRRKESKKASRKASKELADSRKNSRTQSSRNVG
jgi:hypothetical protein